MFARIGIIGMLPVETARQKKDCPLCPTGGIYK